MHSVAYQFSRFSLSPFSSLLSYLSHSSLSITSCSRLCSQPIRSFSDARSTLHIPLTPLSLSLSSPFSISHTTLSLSLFSLYSGVEHHSPASAPSRSPVIAERIAPRLSLDPGAAPPLPLPPAALANASFSSSASSSAASSAASSSSACAHFSPLLAPAPAPPASAVPLRVLELLGKVQEEAQTEGCPGPGYYYI